MNNFKNVVIYCSWRNVGWLAGIILLLSALMQFHLQLKWYSFIFIFWNIFFFLYICKTLFFYKCSINHFKYICTLDQYLISISILIMNISKRCFLEIVFNPDCQYKLIIYFKQIFRCFLLNTINAYFFFNTFISFSDW